MSLPAPDPLFLQNEIDRLKEMIKRLRAEHREELDEQNRILRDALERENQARADLQAREIAWTFKERGYKHEIKDLRLDLEIQALSSTTPIAQGIANQITQQRHEEAIEQKEQPRDAIHEDGNSDTSSEDFDKLGMFITPSTGPQRRPSNTRAKTTSSPGIKDQIEPLPAVAPRFEPLQSGKGIPDDLLLLQRRKGMILQQQAREAKARDIRAERALKALSPSTLEASHLEPRTTSSTTNTKRRASELDGSEHEANRRMQQRKTFGTGSPKR